MKRELRSRRCDNSTEEPAHLTGASPHDGDPPISSGLLRAPEIRQSHRNSSAQLESATLIRTPPHAGNRPVPSGLLRTPVILYFLVSTVYFVCSKQLLLRTGGGASPKKHVTALPASLSFIKFFILLAGLIQQNFIPMNLTYFWEGVTISSNIRVQIKKVSPTKTKLSEKTRRAKWFRRTAIGNPC